MMRAKLFCLIVILPVLLGACGSDSEISPTSDNNGSVDTVEPSDIVGLTAAGELGDLGSQIEGLSFGDCERSSSDFDAGGTLTNPVNVPPRTVLGGRAGTQDDFRANFWRLEVPAGTYIVVAEAFRVFSFDSATRNLTISQPGGSSTPIIEIDEVDSFARQIAVVEVDAESDVFEVTSTLEELESYDLAFYSINDRIPTPEIVNCFSTSVTSIGTTESFNIRDTEDNQFYFVNELPAGAYRLTLSASAVAGDPDNSGITVSVNNESNDLRTERAILFHQSTNSVSSTDVDFAQAQTGNLLLRFSQPPSEQTIEFTVEPR